MNKFSSTATGDGDIVNDDHIANNNNTNINTNTTK